MSRIMMAIAFVAVGICSATWMTAFAAPPDQGIGQQIGTAIDRGVNAISSEVESGWEQVRRAIDRFGIEGRVYSRLHWDKALSSSNIDVVTESDGVIELKGTVPDLTAKVKAVELAKETTGVQQVVDHLTTASPQP